MKRLTWAAMLVAASPAWGGAIGDAERGRIVAQVRCGPCHYLDKPLRKVGPGLAGIYGRAPHISGVPFARWDEAALERWLAGPRAVKPNTRMELPPLTARDRRDIIAWLKRQGTGGHAPVRRAPPASSSASPTASSDAES